jgi:cell fate regulator YaaT (PSP1 superfamily)
MPIVVGVIVRVIKDRVYADVGHFDLEPGQKVIVETDISIEAGTVCEKEKNMESAPEGEFIGKIIRKATEDDFKRIADNEVRSSKISNTVLQRVREHGLEMKLTRVHYSFDRSKLFIYYTSESRVDFRELIKDLGHLLKTRIQMVQIGVRDESKMVGGIGICGRTLCCQNFLKDFDSVTIDMAKEQDLSLNTSKLSGLCGRLLCCIAYENDYYQEIKKGLPQIGDNLNTVEGQGKFAAIDCIKKIVTVEFSHNSVKEFKKFPLDEIKKLNPKGALK